MIPMSNTNKPHLKSDRHDKHFIERVEKSTYLIEHEIAELPQVEGKVHNLDELLKKKPRNKS